RTRQISPSQPEDAGVQTVSLAVGVERDQSLRDENAQDVQARARDEVELPRDRVHAERLLAAPEEAEHGNAAREGGNALEPRRSRRRALAATVASRQSHSLLTIPAGDE